MRSSLRQDGAGFDTEIQVISMTSQEACVFGWEAPMNGERTVTTDDDGCLVARFLRGDAAAFDSLFLKYQDYVYHIIYGIVGSAEEARDLTQEVFLQVYRSLPKFRHGSRFATWLYRIAVNRAVDAARGSRRWRFLALSDEQSLEQIADVLECSLAAAKVRLHRARQVFKEYYVATYGTDRAAACPAEEGKADAARTRR